MKKLLIFLTTLLLVSAIVAAVFLFTDEEKERCEAHKDFDNNGICDVCDEATATVCQTHTDTNHDGLCDNENCVGKLEILHVDYDGNGFCDEIECSAPMNEEKPQPPTDEPPIVEESPCDKCVDKNFDLECDFCGKEVEPEITPTPPCDECVDSDGNGKCDECDTAVEPEITPTPPCDECVDSDGNGKCDECDNAVEPEITPTPPCDECVDSDGNGKCDECDTAVEPEITPTPPCDECVDSDENGKCDECDNAVEPTAPSYPISAVLISGIEINDHVIVYDATEPINERMAHVIQSTLLERAGISLQVKDENSLTNEKYIAVKSRAVSGEEGFYAISDSDGNLEIISEFPNKTEAAITGYISFLHSAIGEVSLPEATVNLRDVFYEDFGATDNDGSDDYSAIKATHDYANEYGHTVVARTNAVYNIGFIPSPITITTSVRWQNATFIIDDSNVLPTSPDRATSLFEIKSDYEPTVFQEDSAEIEEINLSGGLGLGTDRINLGLGYPALLILINADCRYTYYGESGNEPQEEVILIDENGNLDPLTPLATGFDKLTEIYAIRRDDAPITLSDGVFVTRANQSAGSESYARNLVVSRSNTTIQGITYTITDEPTTATGSSPYDAFLSIVNSDNITVTDCLLTAHKSYMHALPGESTARAQKSYVIGVDFSTNVTFLRCNQSNFYGFSGTSPSTVNADIMRADYSRNLEYNSSLLSNFSTEKGVCNVTIKNSTIAKIEVVGYGSLTVESTWIYNDTLIRLYENAGSFWKGNVTLTDVTVSNKSDVILIGGAWYNHDYGYPTEFPARISLDGIRLMKTAKIHIFSDELTEQTDFAEKDEWQAPILDSNGEETGEFETVYNENATLPTQIVAVDGGDYEFVIPNAAEHPFFKDTAFMIQ